MSSNLGGIREIMWCSFNMKKENLKNTDNDYERIFICLAHLS